jgi:hypothetical protein
MYQHIIHIIRVIISSPKWAVMIQTNALNIVI